jgi:hypothetical protein
LRTSHASQSVGSVHSSAESDATQFGEAAEFLLGDHFRFGRLIAVGGHLFPLRLDLVEVHVDETVQDGGSNGSPSGRC